MNLQDVRLVVSYISDYDRVSIILRNEHYFYDLCFDGVFVCTQTFKMSSKEFYSIPK